MREDLPTGTLTLLLTDIEGSTRLLHRLGAAGYADAQGIHRDILRAAFTAHGGVEVDTQGDAFFYVFPTALGCMRGSVVGHRELANHDWPEGEEVKVRMGAHTGTPQNTEEGYVGIAVNTAARIASSAHGGQTLLSEDTKAAIDADLAGEDYTLRDVGAHRLKDIEGSTELYQLVIPDLPSDFPAPRSMETRPNNLPTPLTPFVGRARLVTGLRDLVLRPETRAVTLLGPGGTGKTRLGLRAATELLHHMEDGAFFIGLAAVRDSGLVVSEIASALGIREEADRDLLDVVCHALAEKELLLLIDNFEQVQDAARDVATILAKCSGVKVITTSRQPLRISGERGFPVPPLEFPKEDPLPPLQDVASFEAVRLFADRAQAARWDFELTEENAADVVEICRALDGLPLAIELATARLFEMDTRQLLDALSKRMEVLNQGAVDLLDHQQTLRDLIAWSYDMLSDEEREVWRQLGVFAGGWDLDAAEFVCDPNDQHELAELLPSLESKSLLTQPFSQSSSAEKVLGGGNNNPRYMMLETLREFAVDAMQAHGELAELEDRHIQWFTDLAERAAPELRGPKRDEWMKTMDAELANYRAALTHATNDARNIDAALVMSAVLHTPWFLRGLLTEGRDWLHRALDHSAGADAKARVRAMIALATFERNRNQVDEAQKLCEQALSIADDNEDEEGSANALSQLGLIAQYRGDFEAALPPLKRAIQKFRGLDNRDRLAFTLNVLGMVLQMHEDIDEAMAAYEESMQLGREIDDAICVSTAGMNLGECEQICGDNEAAAGHYRESLRIYNQLGMRNGVAYCLELLAGIDAAAGRGREAALMFGQADFIREKYEMAIESFNLERIERDMNQAKSVLGDDAYAQAFQDGRLMSLEQVIELAMVDEEAVGA